MHKKEIKEMKFKGKIGKSWYITLLLCNIVMAVVYFSIKIHDYSWVLLIIWGGLNIYLIPAIFRNFVVLDKKTITIYFGIYTRVINISDIASLKKMPFTHSLLSASTDCIGIISKMGDSTNISIEDQDKFVNEILRLNKKIKYFIA